VLVDSWTGTTSSDHLAVQCSLVNSNIISAPNIVEIGQHMKTLW